MPDDLIRITVTGLDKIHAAFERFPHEIAQYLQQAGDEAAKTEILHERGLQSYPPATAANAPPTPYYVRGRGTQYKSGNKGESERYGTQFYVESRGYLNTEIGNRSSYAKWLAGEEQAQAMAKIGWRKLLDVAKEKVPQITKVYQLWIDKLIRDLGL